MECVFHPFLKYNVKMFLRDSIEKEKEEDILKQTTGKGRLYDISNDNVVKKAIHVTRPGGT
jgi:hypothetical protein